MIKIQLRYATTKRIDDISYFMRCLWYSAYAPLHVSHLCTSYDDFNYYRSKWRDEND